MLALLILCNCLFLKYMQKIPADLRCFLRLCYCEFKLNWCLVLPINWTLVLQLEPLITSFDLKNVPS